MVSDLMEPADHLNGGPECLKGGSLTALGRPRTVYPDIGRPLNTEARFGRNASDLGGWFPCVVYMDRRVYWLRHFMTDMLTWSYPFLMISIT